MGMSASQARLLSITTRLTNNEFRSQTITNSKLRLADKSTEASQEYMNALNSQKLVYSYYNDNGESEQMNMTAGLIYTYSPLKNQYALVNSAGKVLVSQQDRDNFEDAQDLVTFLGKYGLIDETSSKKKYEKDLAEYETKLEKYQEDMAAYDEKWADYQDKLQAYKEIKNRPDLYAPFSSIVGTSDAPKSCYSAAKNGNSGCFTHLLDYLINYNVTDGRREQDLETSTGKAFTTAPNSYATLDGESAANKAVFENISKNLNKIYCDGCDNNGYKTDSSSKYNILENKKQNGQEITEFDRLKSDYIETENGYELKTLQQKAIDMYYIIQYRDTFVDSDGNSLITTDMMNELLDNFTDGDMQKLKAESPGNAPVAPVLPEAPVEPKYESAINDKNKAQWYVNLWHMMNGSDTSNLVEGVDYDYQNSEDSGNVHNETIFTVPNMFRNERTANYDVFDDNLLNNAEWLQFALEHGIVTLAKTEFIDPSADSQKTPELTSKAITWKSIVYTNASEFRLVDDEVAVAIAEVKYKNAMKEIENQDKKYDQDLKKLDTEHTAMQTEYESIKEAMNKNVERSFKAFS